MARPVNLTVHRNTRERRRRQEVRRAFLADAKRLAADGDVAGYAIVTWTKDLGGRAHWLADGTMPGDCVGEYVKRTIERTVTRHYDVPREDGDI